MKKYLILLFAALLLIAACQKGEEAPKEEAAEQQEAPVVQEQPVLGEEGEGVEEMIVEEQPEETAAEETSETEAAEDTVEAVEQAPEAEIAQEAVNETTEEAKETITIEKLNADKINFEISAGTTVAWLNKDALLYQIAVKDVVNNKVVTTSPGLRANESFEYAFSEPGTLKWFVTSRPAIQGTIVVSGESAETTEEATAE